MALTQHYLVGRIKRRVLRTPAVVGWLCDDRDPTKVQEITVAFAKKDGNLALQVPNAADLIPLSPELTALLSSDSDFEVVLGWPNTVVLVRRAGVLLRGEGDVLHFGRLGLDARHGIERCGYEYIAEAGVEVAVEVIRDSPTGKDSVMLGPEQQTTVGPFLVVHDHSYDPSDRPGTARHAAYRFVVTSAGQAQTPRGADAPYPPDVRSAQQVVALARLRGALEAEEALIDEPALMNEWLDRYEGPRHLLEDACRTAGPAPSQLHWIGDSVVAESPRLFRGEDGAASFGRARITLDATGQFRVERTLLGQAPGRLRRHKP